MRHSCQPGRQECIEPGLVARVDDRRLQLPTQTVQPLPQPPDTDARPVQRKHGCVGSCQAEAEIGKVLDACDGVAKTVLGQMVDQVDQAVLETTGSQVVDHVQDQGPSLAVRVSRTHCHWNDCPQAFLIVHCPSRIHCPPAVSRNALPIASPATVAKSTSVASAAPAAPCSANRMTTAESSPRPARRDSAV